MNFMSRCVNFGFGNLFKYNRNNKIWTRYFVNKILSRTLSKNLKNISDYDNIITKIKKIKLK